ncbi:MAG: hypothetical protein ACFE95_07060 [Candidatus Hodarchaeota archaeon]
MKKVGMKTGEIHPLHVILDEIKTTGNFDPITQRTQILQLEFIPKGETIGGITNIAEDSNVIILSFWGLKEPKIGRVMEIISAIRLGVFYKRINNYIRLKSFVRKCLERGDEVFRFRRGIDLETEKLIDYFLRQTPFNHGEGTFLKIMYLKILRKYFHSEMLVC